MPEDKKQNKAKKVWEKVKWVLVGIAGAILAIMGLRKFKADKQIKDNEEVIEKIEETTEKIEDLKEEIKNTVEESEKITEEVKIVQEESKIVQEAAKDVISNNESILEKYKRK